MVWCRGVWGGVWGGLMLLLVVAPARPAAPDPDPAKVIGMSILDLRKELLGRKWQPRPLPPLQSETADLDGVAADLRRDGVVEVQSCGLTGTVPCIFNYRKGPRCLTVHTRGEYFPAEDIAPHVDAMTEEPCTD